MFFSTFIKINEYSISKTNIHISKKYIKIIQKYFMYDLLLTLNL